MNINIHQGETVERDEQWWDKVEEERKIYNTQNSYSTPEIVAHMARRIADQMRWLEDPIFKSKRMFMMQMETGYRELPAEWMEIAKEWCRDHEIAICHGVMALLHFKARFGCRRCGLELRVILDDAFERAKEIEIFRDR
jgi:hypothetical protein